jgi:hypothetical protein
MLNDQEIAYRLQNAGFKEREIPTVKRDVAKVIISKVVSAYLPKMTDEERAHIQTLSAEDLKKYLFEHAESLPPFTQSEFEHVHDGVWEDYFQSIK